MVLRAPDLKRPSITSIPKQEPDTDPTTSNPPVDLGQFVNDSPGSSGSTGVGETGSSSPGSPSSETNDDTVRSAIGSGSINIGVDTDTDRATETIGGAGSGGSMQGAGNSGGSSSAATEDDLNVGTVAPDESTDTLEMVEQATENATGGAAFGNPNETEDVGSGEAVRTTASGPVGDTGDGLGETDGVGALALAAVAAIGAVVVLGGA